MLLALTLTAALLGADETTAPPSAEPAPAAKDVSLANTRTDMKKSPALLVDLGALVIGTLVTYVVTVGGIAANFGLGGAGLPPDKNDILLLGVMPMVTAAATTWLIGLFDLGQRSLIGSAISSLAGALVGELAGLGVGYAIGQKAAPNDLNGAISVTVLVAPVFAVFGSILFTEIFKPGESTNVSATVVPQKMSDGRWALAPGVGVTF